MKQFLKVLAVMLLAMIVIISACGVWNAAAAGAIEGIYVIASIINFVLEGTAIYYICKRIFKE